MFKKYYVYVLTITTVFKNNGKYEINIFYFKTQQILLLRLQLGVIKCKSRASLTISCTINCSQLQFISVVSVP